MYVNDVIRKSVLRNLTPEANPGTYYCSTNTSYPRTLVHKYKLFEKACHQHLTKVACYILTESPEAT